MEPSAVPRAVAAATSIASSLGLRADDAAVLHDSNKLTLRLLPCDVVARVARGGHRLARFEVEVAQQLAGTESPVVSLDPRVEPVVYERDGFVVTLWTYHRPVPGKAVTPSAYAGALERLHAGMRQVTVTAPHFTDRVAEAQGLVEDPRLTPALVDADRALLRNTLRTFGGIVGDSGAAEQLLHGEPHPGNVLLTEGGVVFVDLETCCGGPVEFDVAHCAEEVAECYSGVDLELVRAGRVLVLAMVTTWRWDLHDQLPAGRALGVEWLGQLRAALE